MIRLGLLLTALTSCSAFIRPSPPAPQARNPDTQRGLAVLVEMNCDPFNSDGRTHTGSGVMVSEWQVLTALHNVDCKSAIATIHVTTDKGKRYRFSSEKEWRDSDIARIQMAAGDSFDRNVAPPTIRLEYLTMWEPVYIQASYPDREEIIGEATGYSYGGAGYGGARNTRSSYMAPTRGGNSGSPVYDINDDLVCIHVARRGDDSKECSLVTDDMIPR